MLYNFQNDNEVKKFRDKAELFIQRGYTVDFIKKQNTRTTRQNSALHLLFTIIANQLNNLGMDYKYFGLKGQVLSTRHTTNTVKEFIWRPIQVALFDIQSTRKINTEQINEIVDVLVNYFGEKGVVLQFPSKETLRELINN